MFLFMKMMEMRNQPLRDTRTQPQTVHRECCTIKEIRKLPNSAKLICGHSLQSLWKLRYLNVYTINRIQASNCFSLYTVCHSHLSVMLPRNVSNCKLRICKPECVRDTESRMMLYLTFMSYLMTLICLCTKLSLIQI